ncbi:MAG: CPBP family intramembrane glutamic endopeptidase [Bacteroidales bacterium]
MSQSIFAVLTVGAGYLVYRFMRIPAILLDKNRDPSDNSREIYWQRITTAIIYGGLPVLYLLTRDQNFKLSGINFCSTVEGLLYSLMIGIILFIINLLNHKQPDNLEAFPQIRLPQWNKGTLVLSALTWIFYLFCYELLFRGFLLFTLDEVAGKWIAILINTLLYMGVHLHKGWKEAAGAVPFGIILCLVCLRSGSFIPAFISHIILALSAEWLSLKAHPAIRLKRN